MLSGFTRREEIRLSLDSRHAGKVIIHKLRPDNFDWLAVQADASDLRVTDENDNLVVFGLDLWEYASRMGQVRIVIPNPIPTKLYFQYKNPAAVAQVASLAATFQAPGIDEHTLAVWHCTETSGTTYANLVPSGPALNIVSGCTRQGGVHLGYKRQNQRIEQATIITGPDALTPPPGNVGFRLDGVTQALQADAGFLDAPPESGTLAQWLWLFAGQSGTLINKRSDDDNYLLVEQVNGNAIHVQKKNNGIITSDWTSQGVIAGQNPSMLLGISWGANGFQVWQNGLVQWENHDDVTAWGAGSQGKFTYGATDNGTLSNHLFIGLIGWPTIHDKQLTSDEWGMRCYHMAFYPVSTQASKFGPVRMVLDGTAPYEHGGAEEPCIFDTGTEYLLEYHASMVGGTNTRCRATSTDLINWTRDPHNPLFGCGHQGEPADITFFGGGQVSPEQGFFTYVNDGTVIKISSLDLTAPSNSDMTSPTAIIPCRPGSWPSLVGNVNIFPYTTGFIAALTGGGQNGPAWQGLFLIAPTIEALAAAIPDAKANGTQKGCPQQTLAFGFVKQMGQPMCTDCFQPRFPWIDKYGRLHAWCDGWIGTALGSGISTAIYHRETPDNFHWYDSPFDIIQFSQRQFVATAEQACNPWLVYKRSAPTLFTDTVGNVADKAILQATTASVATMDELVTDYPRLESGPVINITRAPSGGLSLRF